MTEAHRVIVRAFAGEPLERIVCGTTRRVVHVCRPDLIADYQAGRAGAAGFPWDDTFCFDAKAYARLRLEWEEGCALDWSSAELYNSLFGDDPKRT